MNRSGIDATHTPAVSVAPEMEAAARRQASRRVPVAERRISEKGATLIEYAFVIGFVSLGVGFVLPELLDATATVFDRLSWTVSSAATE
jgi:Flp pilus assembly pilin Flp